MAIALVGSAGAISTVTTTTVTPSFAQATTAGNLLVCIAAVVSSGGSPTLTTSSSGWSQATVNTGVALLNTAIFYKPNSSAGETAPTISTDAGGGSVTNLYAELSEWSGAATSSPVDKTRSAQGTTTSTPSADTTSGELAIAILLFLNSKSATYTISTSWSPAGGTVNSLNNTGATKAGQAFMGSSDIMSSNASADQATWTVTPSTGTQTSTSFSVASFKVASASGTTYTKAGFAKENA